MGATGLERSGIPGEKQAESEMRSEMRSDSAGNLSESALDVVAADPQLAAVVEAWPKLPLAVRAKIIKLASGNRNKKPSHFAKQRPR
jgi:hypothetical protein